MVLYHIVKYLFPNQLDRNTIIFYLITYDEKRSLTKEGDFLTIYRSKRSKSENQPSSKERKPHVQSLYEPLSEADEMLNSVAKKWVTDKVSTNVDPQQLLNKVFTSAEKSKLVQQGTSMIKDLFQNSVDKLDLSADNAEDNPNETSSNKMDWGKIVESLKEKEKSGELEDSTQMKEEAMNIIGQVLNRTKQILDENDKEEKE